VPDVRDQVLHSEVKRFISLPGEKLLVARREHGIVIALPLIFCGFFFLSFIIGTVFTFFFFPQLALIALAITLVVSNLAISFGLKIYTDWYYHFFIITNRKILETGYTPFSRSIDDVFLDQVRITEIDVKMGGFFGQIYDMGDVVIYFDRPSHDKTFTLSNVKNPKSCGIFLADALENIMHHEPIWFKPRDTKKNNASNNYQFADDVGSVKRRSLLKI